MPRFQVNSVFAVFVIQLLAVQAHAAARCPDLETAIRAHDLNAVETILGMRPECSRREYPETLFPLTFAAQMSDAAIARVLLKYGASVGEHGDAPIRVAARQDNLDLIQALVEAGARVNSAGDGHDCTPLYEASWHGHERIVLYLLSQGADLKRTSCRYYSTPLHAAASRNRVGVIGILLDHGAKVDARDGGGHGDTPLHWAAMSGAVEAMKSLYARGADIDASGSEGFLPVHCAAFGNQPAAMDYLISLGKSIEARTLSWFKKTPLLIALEMNSRAAFEYLLQKGAGIHAEDGQGNGFVHYVFSNSSTRKKTLDDYQSYLETFFSRGMPVNGQSPSGFAVPHYALQSVGCDGTADGSLIRFLAFLSQRGVDFNLQDRAGATGLHLFVETRLDWPDCLAGLSTFLKIPTLNVNVKNHKGLTPLAISKARGVKNFEILLKEAGAQE